MSRQDKTRQPALSYTEQTQRTNHLQIYSLAMPLADEQANETKVGQDGSKWATDVVTRSESDQRARPWEAVVQGKTVDTTAGDVIDLNSNPQGACDISVSA
ncbi:hypothetical protein QBC44DRAFT_15759 [Cladorrhinum sp. PSN332]|nr:hypothetical protein QBC44DRAFT_15759 [Cladorrhinum sp. PSN332]